MGDMMRGLDAEGSREEGRAWTKIMRRSSRGDGG